MLRSLLALTFVLAACGDDDFNGLPDAPVIPDGPTDGPTSGLVTLTITVGTTPQEGIKVYFQNSDSTLVDARMTDANGVVSVVMEPGGFVTAIDPFPGRALPQGVVARSLKTFAGVKPGDQLVLHVPDAVPSIGITVNALNEPDGIAQTYILHAPCLSSSGINITNPGGAGSGDPVGTFGISCGATTDFTVVAFDANAQPIKAFTKKNVALFEGATIDLTGETYAAVEAITFSYTQVPANVGSLNVTGLQLTPAGRLFEVFDGALISNGTAMTLPRPRPVIADSLQVTATQMFGPANGLHNVLEWGPPDTSYELAMGNILTPTILLQEYSSLPVYDLDQKAITWTLDGVGRAADFVVGSTRFSRETPVFQQWVWDIASPVTVAAPTVARYPVLPAPDDDLNPSPADLSRDVNELMSADVPGGYDAVRANVLSIDDDVTGQKLGIVAGAAGQVVFQEISFGKGKRTPMNARGVLFPFAERLARKRR
jgi:hypothetical protein